MALDELQPQRCPDAAAATADAAAATAATGRVVRWATAASLLPIPLWFIVSILLAPRPAWRAEYRASSDFSGASVVRHERELSHYWDRTTRKNPGGFDARHSAGRWDTCLSLAEARDIPVMLVADGVASLSIDGVERLHVESSRRRVTRGDVIRFEAGTYHLRVQFEPRSWPSIALLMSLDGRPPRALGSGELAAGARTERPADGPAPCRAP